MRTNPRTPLTILAAAAALGLAACGSSGGGSSDTLAKTDLAKKADAICQTAIAAARKIQAPPGFGTTAGAPQEAAAYLEKVRPITQREVNDLAALKPADDVKADFQDMVAKEKTVAAYLDGLIAKAKASDPTGLQDLAKSPTVGKPFAAAARKIGANGCANT
jgi:hypothetical protein